jgi:DNA-directed RNA polymerase II subunit RPB1
VDPSDPGVAKIQARKKGIARFSAMTEVCEKVKKCPHCASPHYQSLSHNSSSRQDKETATFGTI